MAFFRNDAVNRIYLHSGAQALAQNAGNLFLLVFLMRAGTPAPVALLAQAGIVAGRFALRPLLLPLAKRWGLKPLIVGGAVGIALQYPLLAEVRGPGFALAALVVVAAVAEVLYYGSLQAYFAAVGEPEHRGHHASLREMLAALAAIVAPPACAFALISFGPRPTFAIVAVVQALSVLPLLGAPNVAVRDHAPGAFRAARYGALLIAVDGWLDAGFFFVWQVALFLALGEDIAAFGGAMAAAGLAGAVFGLWLGPHVDAGHGRRAVLIAYGAGAAIVVLRALSLGSPWLAVAANAAGALFMPLLVPPLVAATANMARASPCPLRFAMAAEGGWDTGCFAACLVAAAMLASGAPLELCVLLALPACLAGLVLLRRYYGRPTLV